MSIRTIISVNSEKNVSKFKEIRIPTDLHLIFVKSVGEGLQHPLPIARYGSAYQVIELGANISYSYHFKIAFF
jgi:hypothetical protein